MSDVALAVDLGGTKVEAALIDSAGQFVEGSHHRAPTGASATRDELKEAIRHVSTRALAAAPHGRTVVGAGIGSAGPIDETQGRISPKNLPQLADFDIVRVVNEVFGAAPVTLRLDGTCIALAEQWQGATHGMANSMSMVVSTGVGGGLIIGNRLVSGRSGNAGHIGQIHVAGFGGSPEDADSTTLEAVSSGTATVRWAKAHGWLGATGEDLADACADGDRVALDAVRRSATAVGQAIASTTTLLDLEGVAIGGGFSHVVPDYIDLVREGAFRATVFPYARDILISAAALGAKAPLLGAAALIHPNGHAYQASSTLETVHD